MFRLLISDHQLNNGALLEIEYQIDKKKFVVYAIHTEEAAGVADLKGMDLPIDLFVACEDGLTDLTKIGSYLRQKDDKTIIYVLEPVKHKAPLANWYTVKRNVTDKAINVEEPLKYGSGKEVLMLNVGDGINLAQKLAIQLGIGVGYKAGLNLLAAICLQMLSVETLRVLTVFSDAAQSITIDQFIHEEASTIRYYSNKIAFLGYKIL